MNNSRTKNSVLTIVSSGIRQALTLIMTFVSRTIFIKVLGAEFLGLNGLFTNILSILALSELGIGSAISFYLYRPIAEKNIDRIKSLMIFYKKCYRIVGLIIILLGSMIMPILPKVVNFNQAVPVNLYLVYFLYLLNTASSYLFFAYKQALVIANQEQYKIEKINIYFTFINCFVDIMVLVIFKDYYAYLIFKFLLVLLKNLITANKIDKEYPYLKDRKSIPIEKSEMKSFFKDIGSVFMFKVGSVLFNTTDNIIISVLLGTVVVGYYSNYYMIISQISMLVGIIINAFSAGIGNVIAKESREKQFIIYKQLDFLVFGISIICTTCLFQLLNSFIKLWIGELDSSYILSQPVVLFLCINFYFDTTTQVANSFREASGNFETGRSLQLIGGIVNIVLSIVLGKFFGLAGIFSATIIAKGLITVTPFIMGVGQDVFGFGKWKLLKHYYFNMFILDLSLVVTWILGYRFHMNNMISFCIECFIAFSVPIIIVFVVYKNNPEMSALIHRVFKPKNKVQ